MSRQVGVRCSCDLHDVWMGFFWKRVLILTSLRGQTVRPLTTIYICPLPCCVVRIGILGRERVV
jgi:hypothetical protein